MPGARRLLRPSGCGRRGAHLTGRGAHARALRLAMRCSARLLLAQHAGRASCRLCIMLFAGVLLVHGRLRLLGRGAEDGGLTSSGGACCVVGACKTALDYRAYAALGAGTTGGTRTCGCACTGARCQGDRVAGDAPTPVCWNLLQHRCWLEPKACTRSSHTGRPPLGPHPLARSRQLGTRGVESRIYAHEQASQNIALGVARTPLWWPLPIDACAYSRHVADPLLRWPAGPVDTLETSFLPHRAKRATLARPIVSQRAAGCGSQAIWPGH